MNKDLFSNLRYNRCAIKLDEIEQKFLYESLFESIENRTINANLISKTIKKLIERTDVRYFSENHINVISLDLYERIRNNILEEEVGRNIHTVMYASEPELVKRSISICTQTGKYIIFYGEKEIYFDDEDSAILYARNNKCYWDNKNITCFI